MIGKEKEEQKSSCAMKYLKKKVQVEKETVKKEAKICQNERK